MWGKNKTKANYSDKMKLILFESVVLLSHVVFLQKEAKSTIDTHDGEEQKRAMEDLRKIREVQNRMAKNADELQPGLLLLLSV